ncbi:hypothetical protein [Halomonas sp. GD1P12]|uniref:hypothetical protein n=1 Tax=Halomonas sp. GD1P12 TaxID=2982691 RepID=UPI0021E4146B|nr:hypothetical protein [Halomonas sp. GD1P12]UYF98562.1 hypothetical protein OCT39_09980 [Halomonas sp. GD1P12]
MQLIQTGKYSRVYFDPARDHFIKTFHPKAFDRLRYLTRIRPYPGHNFALVAARLEALGIATPRIVEARPYRLVTDNVHGEPLRAHILDSPNLQEQYLDALAAFDHEGIHCRGLHTENFLVHEGRMVAIDLDAYKLPRWRRYPRREYLDCLSRSLAGPEYFLFERLLERLNLDAQYRPKS